MDWKIWAGAAIIVVLLIYRFGHKLSHYALFKEKPVEQWHDGGDRTAHRQERKRLSENHYMRAQSLSAWLLATLVAVNGGALALDSVVANKGAPFVAGIVLAILSGFASWQEAQVRSGLHYIESLPEGNRTAHGKSKEAHWKWRWPLLRFLAKALNWGALIVFIFGCVNVGLATADHLASLSATVEELQVK